MHINVMKYKLWIICLLTFFTGCVCSENAEKMSNRLVVLRNVNSSDPVKSSVDQEIIVSGMDVKFAKLVIDSFRTHITKNVLAYNGVSLNKIAIDRIFTLPKGEVIIGFISGDVYYSVEFDWENLRTSNLHMNVID